MENIKCDRCGKLYEPLKFKIVVSAGSEKFPLQYEDNLCPECIKTFSEWGQIGKFVYERQKPNPSEPRPIKSSGAWIGKYHVIAFDVKTGNIIYDAIKETDE